MSKDRHPTQLHDRRPSQVSIRSWREGSSQVAQVLIPMAPSRMTAQGTCGLQSRFECNSPAVGPV